MRRGKLNRKMSDAEIRVYACAHALFVLFSVFLVTDRCEGSPAILANPDTGWIGMEYISEKLVKCRYTSSAWHLMPGLLGLFFSVVMLQHFATFQALPVQHALSWQNSVFVALIVATTLGWSMIIGFDHRPAFAQAEPEYVWHFAGVGIFLVSFCALHVQVSWRYAASRAMMPRYGDVWRYSYVAADALYVATCVLFCITALLNHVYHAIVLEYIIFLLFVVMNTASFVILIRICAWQAQPPSAPASP